MCDGGIQHSGRRPSASSCLRCRESASQQRRQAAGLGHPVRVSLPDEPDPLAAALGGADDRVEQVAAVAEFFPRERRQARRGDQAFQVGQAAGVVVIGLAGGCDACAWQLGGRYRQVFLVRLDVGGAAVGPAGHAGQLTEGGGAQFPQLRGDFGRQLDGGRVKPGPAGPPADDELGAGGEDERGPGVAVISHAAVVPS
jgi:hypothetical protein